MASVINTNVASLNAQKNLTQSQNALATSLQRLSSGLRINSAKDDAAGLAISDRFTTQIRGLNQAGRNANDAISLSQTAEGALGEVTSNLQRIRELAVQSANATNSSSDRAALDLEVQQRLAEIDRISSTTAFNGQKILDGSFGNAAFQIGANVGETISLDLTTSMRQADIGKIASATSVDLDTLITTATPAVAGSYTTGQLSSLDFSTAGVPADAAVFTATNNVPASFNFATDQVSFAVDVDGAGSPQTVTLATDTTDEAGFLSAINGQLTGATASVAGGKLVITSDTPGASSAIAVSAYNGDVDGGALTIADFASGTETTPGAAAIVTSNLGFTVDGTNTVDVSTDYTGNQAGLIAEIQADLDATASGVYVVAADGVAGFSITSAVAGATPPVTLAAFTTNTIANDDGGTVVAGADIIAGATFDVSGDFTIQLGDATAVNVADGSYASAQDLVDAVNTALAGSATATLDADNVMTINSAETITVTGAQGLAALTSGTAGVNTASGSLSTVNVTDVASSNEAMRRIDAALGSVSDLRSTFGAVQNRFESTISNLSTAVENLSAARSRILDADFAAETANLTRAQILQQAGTAMLSQANSLPQNVLSLLG
jgi:flagellin